MYVSVHEYVCRFGVHLGVCFVCACYSFSNEILFRLKLERYLDIYGTIEEIVLCNKPIRDFNTYLIHKN